MRILFMGTPRFAVPTLKSLVESQHEIAGVVCQPDRPSGRGQQMTIPPVKEFAQEKKITVLQPAKMKDPAFLSKLEALQPDLAVVAAFGRILPAQVLKIPKLGCINVHASLLPKYRGAAPIQWAIIQGETETGITTMQMDEGMDTGPILLQEKTQIHPDESAGRLAERLSTLGARLLMQTLDLLHQGKLRPKPQDNNLASAAPLLKKENGRIPWDQSALQIANLIRGLDPWPGAYTFYQDQRWRLYSAKALEESPSAGPAGRILRVEKQQAQVTTGKGILAVKELQPDNGRRMTFQEYLAGHPVREGEVLQ